MDDVFFTYVVSVVKTGYTVTRLLFAPLIASDVDDEDEFVDVPDGVRLHQNYPNPFNPATTIAFEIPRRSPVTLSVVNVLGRRVKTLVNRSLPMGSYTFDWDGTNAAGDPVASGVYFYRLTAGAYVDHKKMVLLR